MMAPDVFLRTTTTWGEPKVAFRKAGIDDRHRRRVAAVISGTESPLSSWRVCILVGRLTTRVAS